MVQASLLDEKIHSHEMADALTGKMSRATLNMSGKSVSIA